MSAGWFRQDVREAANRIDAAVPGVYLEFMDYGYGLLARKGAVAVVVFQPPLEPGDIPVRSDVDETIKTLQGAAR